MTLLEIVKDNRAEFSHYRAGYAYYAIEVEGEVFSFPVSLEDIGQATLNRTHKAIELMRYIRKAKEDNTFVFVGLVG